MHHEINAMNDSGFLVESAWMVTALPRNVWHWFTAAGLAS